MQKNELKNEFELDYEIDLLKDIIDYNKEKYFNFREGVYTEPNIEYERILKARYNKVSRIKKRLIYLLVRYDYIWFVTFTFDNYYINKSDRTKRDLMKEVLNTHDFKYMLNIDYGKKTEREHYHCIIATNQDLDLNQYIQEYYPCFSKSILCKKGKGDFVRLSKYINKLSNHCIKATTKRRRMLFNFKGYDIFGDDSQAKFLAFTRDKIKLFSVEEGTSECRPT